MKKVLFSCVGSTDPVRGLRDGAMLHIVRHYLPDKIIWFISEEMKKLDDNDHRYDLAMQKFFELHPDYHPEIVREYSDITDVSEFDMFYEPFERIVSDALEQDPDAEILLNLSSGTTQMKMTMALLAMDVRYRTKGVQVKSPEKKASTAQRTTETKYDAATEIELNEDDEPGMENRCGEPQLFLVRRQAERQRIEALLQTYNYGALRLLRESLPVSCRGLVEHLAQRAEYNTGAAEEKAEKLRGHVPFPLYPMKPENRAGRARKYRAVTEYYLCLKLLQQSGQLTNLVVRLNPLVVTLQEVCLREKYAFHVQDIMEKTGGKEYITANKVNKCSPELKQYLDDELGIMREKSFPSIRVYNLLLRYFSEEDEALELFEQLERLNETQRNTAAHTLDNVTEDDIVRAAGCGSAALMKKLEALIGSLYADICNPKIFSIYETCNDYIKSQL